jgi:hypothetical protein
MLDIIKEMAEEIDGYLRKAYDTACEVISYISSFTFTPVNWIDSQPFVGQLYIAIDTDGTIKIYDDKLYTYYPIYELDIFPTLFFIYRFMDIAEKGDIKMISIK